MIKTIKKRNGEVVAFDSKKIKEAIHKANVAVADEKIPAKQLKELTDKVVAAIPADTIPTVEQIQDMVEEALIAADYAKTAKAYILYRAEHAKDVYKRQLYECSAPSCC